MSKKIFKYENMITLYVKARNTDIALNKLNKRLNRITNQDVFYIPNNEVKETIINKETLEEDIKNSEISDIVIKGCGNE